MDGQESENLDDLVRKARAGKKPAKERLFAVTRPKLIRIVQADLGQRVGTRADPSDAVQEVLLRALRKFDQFRGDTYAEFFGWCLTIQGNEIIDLERRHHAVKRDQDREQGLGSSGEGQLATGSSASPPTRASRAEQAELVEAAISRLAPDYREVLQLRIFEGKSWADVASLMGRNEDAVQKLCTRALEHLENDDQVQRQLGDSG